MRIIYKGRLLQNDIIIGDAINIGLSDAFQGDTKAKFHLLIDKKKFTPNVEENKTQAIAGRIQAERRARQPAAPPPAE